MRVFLAVFVILFLVPAYGGETYVAPVEEDERCGEGIASSPIVVPEVSASERGCRRWKPWARQRRKFPAVGVVLKPRLSVLKAERCPQLFRQLRAQEQENKRLREALKKATVKASAEQQVRAACEPTAASEKAKSSAKRRERIAEIDKKLRDKGQTVPREGDKHPALGTGKSQPPASSDNGAVEAQAKKDFTVAMIIAIAAGVIIVILFLLFLSKLQPIVRIIVLMVVLISAVVLWGIYHH